MIENKLNLKYYSGQDLYSDGDVEDELLAAVQNPDSIEADLLAGNSWPHLYHLSNIRENILEWYDFDPKGSLLEIGSGCGALSGLFCSKVDHVVAIELSKRRSMINATRNQKHDNLTIMLGNFEDIQLEEKFDYVTLIGVFEYSICYINSENPFMDMLARAKSFLKPGGKLLIAIENKYGLKYFAGATEDHSGRVFDGVENYVAVNRVRTFSHGTLEKMLQEAGFTKNDFYYPMPDYKLPNEIYSEKHMPGFGSIRNATVAYDRDRYELFDERLAYDSICEDGLFGHYANSFLIVSENGQGEARSTVEYAKYNRQRAPQFQISTRIIEKDGVKTVEKKALRDEAVAHVNSLKENREKLVGVHKNVQPIDVISCENGVALFPFCKGRSLVDEVNARLGNKEKLIAFMHETVDKIYESKSQSDFKVTGEFEKLFGKGDWQVFAKSKSLGVSNIDSIFSNFMVTDAGYVCLDYEWVCDFPVPVDYLKYRTVYYYFSENRAYIEPKISENDFLAEFGITQEMLEAFRKMDDNFQQYVHGENRKYIYTSNYAKTVTNIGKNFQNGEPWFLSIMKDLNVLNHTLGEHRRDLVTCRIDMKRKNELVDRLKYAAKNPGQVIKNKIRRFLKHD